MEHSSFATSLGVSKEIAAELAYDSRTADGLRSVMRTKYSHEAMADVIIAQPTITQNELGKIFGRTTGWVSIVLRSDAFQAFLAKRRGEIVDPVLTISVRERFEAVVAKSTEVLLEKLSKPVDSIADSTVLKAAEIGAKALGIGGNAAPVSPPGDYLPGLAQRLIALSRGSKEVIEDANFTLIEDRPGVRAEGSSDGRPEAADAANRDEAAKADGNRDEASRDS